MNDPGPFFDDRIRCPSYEGGTETPEYTVPWLISRHGIQAKTVTKIDPEVILKMISYHVKQNNLCWLASTLDALKDQ